MVDTLQDLRKKKFQTVKAFAQAWGCAASTGSHILNGRHHIVFSPKDIERLAKLFEVPFTECVNAANETYRRLHNFSSDDPSAPWLLRNQWLRRGEIESEAREWAKRGGRIAFPSFLEKSHALSFFGLSSDATHHDILKAFREKVKSMADGKGGYVGDMDKLVQAKEKALAYVQRQA